MQKTKKIILSIILVVIFLGFGVWYVSRNMYSFAGNKIENIEIGNKKFQVEIVFSEQKMEKGLGEREGICDSCGMLFKFAKAGKYSFWMKDMQFPLDIVWISDHKIVHIEKNVQPTFKGILDPIEDANMVLEVNAGILDEHGIKVGDEISL